MDVFDFFINQNSIIKVNLLYCLRQNLLHETNALSESHNIESKIIDCSYISIHCDIDSFIKK